MTYQEKGKTIYNSEEWSFPIPAQMSGLAERLDFAVAFKELYPEIKFGRFYLSDGNILIQDCSPNVPASDNDRLNQEINQTLNTESKVTFQIVDGLEATQELLRLLKPDKLKNTLVVYPGNGALAVKKYLTSLAPDIFEGVYVPTYREMINKGKFNISVDLPDELPHNFSRILVVDDVVASGQTARAIACALARKLGNLPPVNLACWLMLDKQDQYYPAGLPYYQSVYSAYILKGNGVSRPPINSLSCLLSDEGKYETVKKAYLDRYLGSGQTLEKIKDLF